VWSEDVAECTHQLMRDHIHDAAVLGRSVVAYPFHSPILAHEDEGVARFSSDGMLPLQHVVSSRNLVSGIRKDGREVRKAEFRPVCAPCIWWIWRDADEFHVEPLECWVLQQVDHLQDASASARAHAEVQQHGPVASVVGQPNGLSAG